MKVSRRFTVAVTIVTALGLASASSSAWAKGGGGGGGGTVSAGTISVSPSSTTAGVATSYILRYQAKGGFTNQIVSFGIPSGFTPPTIGGSGPGAVSVLKGTCTWTMTPIVVLYDPGTGSQYWVQFPGGVSCPKGGNYLQIAYNKATQTVAGKYLFPGYMGTAPAAPATVTVNPAAPASMAFTSCPSTGAAGTALSPTPAVLVQDAYGNNVSGGSSVTLALKQWPSGTQVPFDAGTTTVAPVNGAASFPGMKVNTAGAYTLTATLGSLSADCSVAFTIVPGATSQLVFLAPVADTAVDSTLNGSLGGIKVALEDAYGNVQSGDNSTVVSMAIKSPNVPGGTLSGFSSGPTAVNGVATFTDLSINRQGVYTLTASAGALSQDSNSFTINGIVMKPNNGAGNWWSTYALGGSEWWLFEYGLPTSSTPDVPPNLTVNSAGAPAALGDLTGSGASGWSWSGDTADDRALQNPCFGSPSCASATGLSDSIARAAGALFSTTSFTTTLQFPTAFTGRLTLYAVDWDSVGRDETIVVHDALGDQTVNLSAFSGGAYASLNISTGSASNVTITVTNNNPGANAVLSGVFLN